jgi:hypothetical protein
MRRSRSGGTDFRPGPSVGWMGSVPRAQRRSAARSAPRPGSTVYVPQASTVGMAYLKNPESHPRPDSKLSGPCGETCGASPRERACPAGPARSQRPAPEALSTHGVRMPLRGSVKEADCSPTRDRRSTGQASQAQGQDTGCARANPSSHPRRATACPWAAAAANRLKTRARWPSAAADHPRDGRGPGGQAPTCPGSPAVRLGERAGSTTSRRRQVSAISSRYGVSPRTHGRKRIDAPTPTIARSWSSRSETKSARTGGQKSAASYVVKRAP